MRFTDTSDTTPERKQRLVRVLSRHAAAKHEPLAGEVCISITNPRQSAPPLEGYTDILRLGFHDTDREGGNFTVMSREHAQAVLEFGAKHKDAPLMVHCEAGASRSVGVGLFLAAWLNRPLLLTATDVLEPNPWVINQLRAAALYRSLSQRDWRLLACAVFGNKENLAKKTPD
ncbi:hypothetical protein WJ97_13340 [Burkholderia ubonensis]|uniref:hypothetical protein n=1 Tax=Burkholderia ubonensis TaxID=101571 RepID=UPI00075DCD5F|nr:hypothetical protein [Burkholderia ubonensis]KVP96857.1 hypothetical protein WJ97_13340 [Burkholderia ubonensis]